MSGDPFRMLCVILANMPYGTAPAWSDGMMTVYRVGLRNLPEDAAPALAEAIVDRCQWRPTVHEIIEIWRQIVRPTDTEAAPKLVADIIRLRDRWGEYVVPHPDFPRLLQSGEPDWSDPMKRAVIATFGGWVAFCRDDSPPGVLRGQMLRVAESVISGGTDETIQRLRLEYREMRAGIATEGAGEAVEIVELASPLPRIGAFGRMAESIRVDRVS